MTGPEHYAEAERLISKVTQLGPVPGRGPVIKADAPPEVIALAQVHATLALAAATALEPSGVIETDDPDYLAWVHVASIARPIGVAP